MAPQVNLSMQDLARLALGNERVTNVNIAILHSLLNLILKKLNCQDETVSIGGYESKCLEKLLNLSKTSPLVFNDEKVKLITEKLDKLPDLEKRVYSLDQKLKKHFDDIHRCQRVKENKDNPFDFAVWESYENTCEDLCTTSDPKNEIGCSLLANVNFMRKLMRRISKPVVDRIFELENKIDKLHDEFVAFMNLAEEEFKKIRLIEKCIYEIEALRKKIDDEHGYFIRTMEEVQDMLDAKLDRIHIPPMKKWIKDRFEKLEADVKDLQTVDKCTKAAGVLMGDVKCVSCGANKVCADLGAHPVGVLPNAQISSYTKYCKGEEGKKKKEKIPCGCTSYYGRKEPTLMVRMVDINAEKLLPIKHPEQGMFKCKLAHKTRNEHLVGSDGNIYRAE